MITGMLLNNFDMTGRECIFVLHFSCVCISHISMQVVDSILALFSISSNSSCTHTQLDSIDSFDLLIKSGKHTTPY